MYYKLKNKCVFEKESVWVVFEIEKKKQEEKRDSEEWVLKNGLTDLLWKTN